MLSVRHRRLTVWPIRRFLVLDGGFAFADMAAGNGVGLIMSGFGPAVGEAGGSVAATSNGHRPVNTDDGMLQYAIARFHTRFLIWRWMRRSQPCPIVRDGSFFLTETFPDYAGRRFVFLRGRTKSGSMQPGILPIGSKSTWRSRFHSGTVFNNVGIDADRFLTVIQFIRTRRDR